MHPLLSRKRRLGLYFLAWIPLSLFVIYLLRAASGIFLSEAVALAVPLCVVYAFLCLSAWYSCKSVPLEHAHAARLAVTHLSAAALISGLWVQLGRVLAFALSRLPQLGNLDWPNLSARYRLAQPVLFVAGVLLYLLAIAYYYVILSLEASREAQERVMESSVLARDAELKALKAQVNPHFLFNSLNSISALTTIDPAKAREMCILLAEFLRMTLGLGEKAAVSLGEELQLLERFLAIEKVRFGARLQMREEVQEAAKAAMIPPLLLQPLVENAVTHGVANLLEGGEVQVAAQANGTRLTITVENTFDPDSVSVRRGGLGLANVRRRLEARYGKDAEMRVSAEGSAFRVLLALPFEAGAEATAAPAVSEALVAERAR
jgi:two-component system, LytTR family, sensor histidine kinase AlgZ